MDLTKIVLAEDLTQEERTYLHSMTFHDGFPVLQKIFDAACRMVTQEVMKVDPRSPNFKDVLAATQQDARAVNEFCAAVRKSFLYHEQKMAVNKIQKEAQGRISQGT